MYVSLLKRMLDLFSALVLSILLSPILLALALLIRIKLGSPVLFRQKRPGKDGVIFTLVKFRTMKDAVDQAGRPLPDEERMTNFGRKLRRSSLDELPELWNVIRGDMSFVGPRPLLPEYLALYSKQQARRHEVRPGLTGLGQVSGRNSLGWSQRFELDVWYVDNISAKIDASIVKRTLMTVVGRKGVSAEGEATMLPFDGN